jgi:cobalt-zinc-cadmium efflux system membrane fusion protein
MLTNRIARKSLCLAAFLLAGCGKESGADQSQAAATPTAASTPSVKLAASQLGSIAIGRAQTYLFPVERDAVGSVNFADDPAIIQAESTLLAAAASLDLTRKELNRVRSLGKNNGIAEKELDQATSDEQTADAALRAARDGVRALGKTDAQIDHMIKSGRIEAASGHAESKWVIANAVELDSPLLRAGQTAKIKVLALPDRTFEGAVSEVYSTVDPNSHRITLRIQVADPTNELRSGMLSDVSIEVDKPEPSIGIPANGVVREGDGTMTVWVTSDRTNFYQRTVKTGLREGGLVQILQGLQPGESVVTNGAIFLDNLLQAPPSD